MRLIAFGLVAVACAAGAVDEPGNSIARFGNQLIITAPDADAADPSLIAALRQRITIDLVEASIGDVTDFLRTSSGTNIVVAPDVLANSPPITLQAKDMSLGNVVTWVSRLAGCEVTHLHGALYFSNDKQPAPRVTKIYDISSLTIDVADFPGPELGYTAGKNGFDIFTPTPASDAKTSEERADDVIDLIKKQVEPGTWRE
jgi:hypothetical protein